MVILESIQVYNFFCGSKMRKRGRRWTLVDPSVIPGSLGSPRRCDRVEGSKQKAGGTTRGSGGSPGTPSWTLDAIYNPQPTLLGKRNSGINNGLQITHKHARTHCVPLGWLRTSFVWNGTTTSRTSWWPSATWSWTKTLWTWRWPARAAPSRPTGSSSLPAAATSSTYSRSVFQTVLLSSQNGK